MNSYLKKLKIVYQFIFTKKYTNREKLINVQNVKLKKLLLSINSNYYKSNVNLFKKTIKNNKNFININILNNFNIINKKIFMKNFEEINSVKLTLDKALEIAQDSEKSRDFTKKHKDITIGLSSGTSGNKGVFLVSEEESSKWVGYILKRMLPKPYFKQHEIAFFLRANSNLYESVSSSLIKFKFYDLLSPIENYVNELNIQQPTILIAPAQVLKLLSLNKDLKINPKKIISVAEVLENEDKKIIENRFNQIVHQIYQCTEGFLGHTCEYGNIHLNEDIVIIEKEWIDEKSNRFSPIVTDLNRVTQPVIRYKLDDILIENKEKCECGSCFTRVEKIEGRCDDILKMTDINNKEYLLFPDFVSRSIISINEPLEEYKIIKSGDILKISIKPFNEIIKKEINISLNNLYEKHSLKPLRHEFDKWNKESLSIKRRRVIEMNY